MNILVTGGCGFIGSHCVVELLNANYDVVVIDDFSNSDASVIDSIKTITSKEFKFYEGDVKDAILLDKVFTDNKIDAVILFAGYKAVGESVAKPLMYYENNIGCAIALCKAMDKYNCRQLIFSSSATVYGEPQYLPLDEKHSLSTTNPYGSTKLMIEDILRDLYASDNTWNISILRYFNPIGAHESGLIGENPKDIPNNLMPFIIKVASNQLECLSVFGDDYDTEDGTGVRDYIHVYDLVIGHLKAIDVNKGKKGVFIYNLGTGIGYSVFDIINTFNKVNDIDINYKVVSRRSGDIAINYADTTKAYEELGFKASKTIEDMCRDSYNFAIKKFK